MPRPLPRWTPRAIVSAPVSMSSSALAHCFVGVRFFRARQIVDDQRRQTAVCQLRASTTEAVARQIIMRTIVLFAICLLCSMPAHAHASLDSTNPQAGSTVLSSPSEVTLHFTQRLEPKFSKAEVRNAAGVRVDQGANVSGNEIRVGVTALPPGTYRVIWHVLSVDTHTTQGSFSFHVGR
jgi:copper resistance protein C